VPPVDVFNPPPFGILCHRNAVNRNLRKTKMSQLQNVRVVMLDEFTNEEVLNGP
jgi:hypothetical protein